MKTLVFLATLLMAGTTFASVNRHSTEACPRAKGYARAANNEADTLEMAYLANGKTNEAKKQKKKRAPLSNGPKTI